MSATIPERTAQPDRAAVDQTDVAVHDLPTRSALSAGESVAVLLTAPCPRAGDARTRARTADRWRRGLSVALVVLAVVAVGNAVRQTAQATDLTTTAAVQAGPQLRLALPEVDGAVTVGDHVTLPSTALEGLAAGDVRTFTVEVANDTDTGVLVATAFAWAPVPTGQGFVDAPDVRVQGVPPHLEAGESASATVRVSTPRAWDAANRGRTGRLVVRFVGTPG